MIIKRKCGRCKQYFDTGMYVDCFICPHCRDFTDNRPKDYCSTCGQIIPEKES